MTRGADMLHEPSWDVVQEPEGFSAEATVEHELSLADAVLVESRVRNLAPAVRADGALRIRGTVSIDDRTLWVYANVVGPGTFDERAREATLDMLEHLWQTVQAD